MTDDRALRLLEEIRDLQRQHVERYAEALRNQQESIRLQQDGLRRVRVVLALAAFAAILAVAMLVLLLLRVMAVLRQDPRALFRQAEAEGLPNQLTDHAPADLRGPEPAGEDGSVRDSFKAGMRAGNGVDRAGLDLTRRVYDVGELDPARDPRLCQGGGVLRNWLADDLDRVVNRRFGK